MSGLENQCKQRGFTLIELSVVLVVVGLIVGAVFVGETMRRSGQIQRVLTDEGKYVEAARSFKEKYGYLPGDFPNATSYWGTNALGCGQWPTPTNAPSLGTCNGNGDGHISGDGTGQGNSQQWETFEAWQQLADAGYIEGQFSGTGGKNCSVENVAGVNEPAASVTGGSFEWNFYNPANNLSPSQFLNVASYQQYLMIGAYAAACSSVQGQLFTPLEAQSIDGKIDDGLPGSGKWTSNNTQENSLLSPCTTTDVAATALYNTSGVNKGAANNFKPSQLACIFLVEVDW